MLMIKKLAEPADTVSQFWCVQCALFKFPVVSELMAQDIIRYATYPVGAYRTNPQTKQIEYLVEFGTTGGFISKPMFYTEELLRNTLRKILHNR